MRNDFYPPGTVQALMSTNIVSTASKQALQARLDLKPVTEPKFFAPEIFATLQAVSARLIPQTEPERMIDLAGCLDGIVAEGKGNGWRYNEMPADEKTYTLGLYGIDETSIAMFGSSFRLLAYDEQDAVLTCIQTGKASGYIWDTMSAKLFFEELLAALVELYYSHPYAKEEIGEVAMADVYGWQKTGMNELEAHEPKTLENEMHAGYGSSHYTK